MVRFHQFPRHCFSLWLLFLGRTMHYPYRLQTVGAAPKPLPAATGRGHAPLAQRESSCFTSSGSAVQICQGVLRTVRAAVSSPVSHTGERQFESVTVHGGCGSMNVLGGFIALFVVAIAMAVAVLALNGLATAIDKWPFIGMWLMRVFVVGVYLFIAFSMFMIGASFE